jgi:transposase-like protein
MRTRSNPPAIVRYGLYLYFISSNRSFRLAAKCLEFIVRVGHVSIWKWVQKYSAIGADGFRMDKHRVKEILFVVDETLLQIDGQEYWLWWIAYEPNVNK